LGIEKGGEDIMSFPLPSEYEVETCIHENCGVHFAVPKQFQDKRRKDHKTFYCPNGHPQYYPHKSDLEILKDRNSELAYQVSNLRIERGQIIEREKKVIQSRAAYKAHFTRLKNRSAAK
jgi:hypothetical protein